MKVLLNEACQSLKKLFIIFLFGITFFLAGGSKWLDGKAPDWFVEQFSHTFLAYFPQNLLYLGLAFVESLVAFFAILSLVSREWIKKDSPYLKLTLLMSLMVFVALGFGARLSHKFQDAAFHFMYFSGTLLALFVVELEERNHKKN